MGLSPEATRGNEMVVTCLSLVAEGNWATVNIESCVYMSDATCAIVWPVPYIFTGLCDSRWNRAADLVCISFVLIVLVCFCTSKAPLFLAWKEVLMEFVIVVRGLICSRLIQHKVD